MSMNTFIIEQKQEQVSFHGYLQHEDRIAKSQMTDDEGSGGRLIDFRETNPDNARHQEICKGVTSHIDLMPNFHFHTRPTSCLELSFPCSCPFCAAVEVRQNWLESKRTVSTTSDLLLYSPVQSDLDEAGVPRRILLLAFPSICQALTIYDSHKLWQNV